MGLFKSAADNLLKPAAVNLTKRLNKIPDERAKKIDRGLALFSAGLWMGLWVTIIKEIK